MSIRVNGGHDNPHQKREQFQGQFNLSAERRKQLLEEAKQLKEQGVHGQKKGCGGCRRKKGLS